MSEVKGKGVCPFHNPKLYMAAGAALVGLLAVRYFYSTATAEDSNRLIVATDAPKRSKTFKPSE